jgi:hypothetical protein
VTGIKRDFSHISGNGGALKVESPRTLHSMVADKMQSSPLPQQADIDKAAHEQGLLPSPHTPPPIQVCFEEAAHARSLPQAEGLWDQLGSACCGFQRTLMGAAKSNALPSRPSHYPDFDELELCAPLADDDCDAHVKPKQRLFSDRA